MTSISSGPKWRSGDDVDERGLALIIVLVMIAVLSVLLAAVAQDAVSSSYTSRHAQD